MHKVTPYRLAIILAFIAALMLLATPLFAAPVAQNSLPNFTLNAQTVISVTVAITDGQVIVVPVDLIFTAQNSSGETDVSLITEVEQQPGLFIGVAPAPAISATLELPQTATDDDDTPSETIVTSGEGTHVANNNSNKRGGPGTNFPIVGRVPRGQAVTVVGANNDGSWLELDDGSWVAEFLLDPIPNNDTNDDNNGGGNNDDDSNNNSNDDEEADAEEDDVTVAPLIAPGDITAYVIQVATIGGQASAAVDALNALIQDPQPLNNNWSEDVRGQLGSLANALDQYLDLTPVAGYEDLHAQVTDVALTCEQAVDYLMTGLDNPLAIDPALATQSVQACAAKATNLAAEVQTIQT